MTDEEIMALCAIRYTIGRMSYIVSDGMRWARKYGKESAWVRDVLIRDLQEAVKREGEGVHALGWKTDAEQWHAVLAELLMLKSAPIYNVVLSSDGKWQIEGASATVYVSTEEEARSYAYAMNQAFEAGIAAKAILS